MKTYVETSYLPVGYNISKEGNVISKFGKVLKNSLSNSGYKFINIKNKGYFIHRAICFAFIPKVEGCNFVNHKDGNKLNNLIENLEWCTKSYNTKHAYELGLKTEKVSKLYKNKFGIEHNRSVKIIINKVTYNGYSEASRKLGIGISIIHYRVNSKNIKWMHFEIDN